MYSNDIIPDATYKQCQLFWKAITGKQLTTAQSMLLQYSNVSLVNTKNTSNNVSNN